MAHETDPNTLADEPISAVLIEDDERLARYTAGFLERHGVRVVWAETGEQGLYETARVSPDVVMLDIQLPGLDGLAICREIRARSDVPIVMLTARDTEADRVTGLELGADDYLPKPFSSRELLARIRAHVRRHRGRLGPRTEPMNLGRLVLIPEGMQALLDGRPLSLTSYEFQILRALGEHVGKPLTRERLMLITRGNTEDAFDRSVDVQISRLRQKLGDDPRNPQLIKTVRGAGYMLAKTAA